MLMLVRRVPASLTRGWRFSSWVSPDWTSFIQEPGEMSDLLKFCVTRRNRNRRENDADLNQSQRGRPPKPRPPNEKLDDWQQNRWWWRSGSRPTTRFWTWTSMMFKTRTDPNLPNVFRTKSFWWDAVSRGYYEHTKNLCSNSSFGPKPTRTEPLASYRKQSATH